MRTIPAAALAKLATKTGTKPIITIEIEWKVNGGRETYADKDFNGAPGKIVKIDNLDAGIKISEGSDSVQVGITLDDIDGSLKNILDHNDVHKRPCWIYQSFEGLTNSQKFLLLRGEISSPITWDEGAQTVEFQVISKIESTEVGFSIEEGQFAFLPTNLIGVPWPLCFGSVINVPTLKITTPREGTLAEGFGITDFTLDGRIALANQICCPSNYITGYTAVSGPVTQPTNPNPNGQPPDFYNGGEGGLSMLPTFGPDPSCVQNKCETIEQLKFAKSQQDQYVKGQVRIFGGERFQQDRDLAITIAGARFYGKFDDDIFHIHTRIHPDIIAEGTEDVNTAIAAIRNRSTAAGTISSKCPDTTQLTDDTDCQRSSMKALNDYPQSNFFWMNAGEKVQYAADEEIIYIANILPSEVIRVSAFRTLENANRKLLTVPTDYYSVRTTDYTAYTATEIVLDRPLSQRGDGWEDDIFVTLTSSVGPNTIDIMKWLIAKYTNFVADTVTFDTVKSKLENYPSHFAMLERKNILDMLEEMAFQCRCAIFLRDNTLYIKYLSEEPEDFDTFTEDDVLQNSLRITHTETEELVTKFVASWKEDLSKDEPNKIILRNNISKYGTQSQDYDFYMYNIYELVLKSATFWLIRKSNTWRRLIIKTPLTKLALEPFDSVQMDLSDFTPNPVHAIVEKATYVPDDHSIEFEFWTPVRSGEQTEYPWGFPGTVDGTLKWPPDSELEDGTFSSSGSPGFLTVAPGGHPLNAVAVPTPPVGNAPVAGQTEELSFNMGPSSCAPAPGNFVQEAQLDFCCGISTALSLDPVDGCDPQKPKRQDDTNDKKPKPKTNPDDTDKLNKSKEPKFDDGEQSKIKEAVDKANQAIEEAAKAKDVANGATEAAGGAGGSGDPSKRLPPENPYCKLPKPGSFNPPKKNGPGSASPDERAVCKSLVSIASFQVYDCPCGCGTCHCPIPGSEKSEVTEYAGCGDGSDFPTGGAGAFVTRCNGTQATKFTTVITPDCDACAAPTDEYNGKPIGYEMTNPTTGDSLCGSGAQSTMTTDYNPVGPAPTP